MFEVVFYETREGKSGVWDFMEELRIRSSISKDARIQYNQLILQIELLAQNGTRLPNNITKHIEGDIWELRPGSNRILYFFFRNNVYVLLHQFRKTTNKTPKREIEKAKAEMKDFLERNG